MHKLWIQAAMMLAGTLRGTVGGALSYLGTLLKSGFTTATQFHQEGIAFAREMGMSAREAQAYTEVLTDRTERLAAKYGVTAEQVKELQRNISIATSKQLMLNDTQSEQFLQLNKLVGSSTVAKFTEEMMNGMGGSLDSVTGAVYKAYATAAKSGLNAQKVSEKIASSLKMANRLSFRDGVNGLTRMAIQAEKVGMNLQSVETAAGKFMDLDKAIENAAQMQMLGGSAAANFGNPLTAAYEANYDPEAFAKRLQGSLASYATFDATKGVSSINGMNMDFVKNIANAMGISVDEASSMAKKQAEVKFKESHISSAALNGLSQEQRDFLINKSNVANGKVSYTTTKGETFDLSGGESVPEKVLKEMMKYEGKSDRDIMEENARTLTSINEKLSGFAASISAMFAKFLEGLFPDAIKQIDSLGAFAKNKLEPVAKNIGEAARGVFDWFKTNEGTIESVFSSIVGFLKFATEHWKMLLGILGGLKLLNFLGNAGIIGGKGGKVASAAASSASNLFGKMHQGSAHDWFSKTYQRSRNAGNPNRVGRIRAFGGALKDSWQGASKLAKGTAALGVVTGIAQGVGAISDYNRRKEEINNSNMSDAEKKKALEKARIDKNSEVGGAVGAGVGTLLGTFFFGPLGGMIGGAVGEFAGKFIGKYWDPIVDTVTSFMKKLWEGIKWLADNNPIGLMVKGVGKLFGKDWSIFGGEKHAQGGVVGGNSYSGDKVLARLNSGEAVITPKQFNALFNVVDMIAKKKETSFNSEIMLSPTQQRNFMALANDNTTIQAKPVGNPEYIYKPNGSSTSNVNGNTITVKDFNINLNGTLKLDGGNYSKNIDMGALLNDYQFMNALKEMIKTSINNDMNGGRFMNDLASIRGQVSSSSIIGK